ncbi:rhomboid family intramembrane serine protease [Myxococcota bacterium]|nr:rhomboid family intramembrane serine protease [Myxococcota bacterium]
MQCPRCTYPLTVIRHPRKPLEIDQCRRCGGVFLEPHEAGELLGPHAEPDAWLRDPSVTDLGPDKLTCPHDATTMRAYVLASETEGVQLDHCPTCRGVWFDDKEGRKLFRIMQSNQQKARVVAGASDDQDDEKHQPTLWSYLFQLLTQLPVEGYHPTKRHPLVLYALVLAILVAFGWEMYVIVSEPQNVKEFLRQFACTPQLVKDGQGYLGLFTHMFLHAGFWHLFGNLYFLAVFGDNVEDALGKSRFVALYVVAGLVGALLHVFLAPDPKIPLIGASGAIAGVMGAYVLLFPNVKIWVILFLVRFPVKALYYLLFWVGFQLVMWGFFSEPGKASVAWMAHVGGFAAGLVISYVMLLMSPVVQVKTGRVPV